MVSDILLLACLGAALAVCFFLVMRLQRFDLASRHPRVTPLHRVKPHADKHHRKSDAPRR